jgi:hypothetical protein
LLVARPGRGRAHLLIGASGAARKTASHFSWPMLRLTGAQLLPGLETAANISALFYHAE